MNHDTARALQAINRAFYRERAAEFSATREAVWKGWEGVLGHVRSLERTSGLRVLEWSTKCRACACALHERI